MVTDSRSAAPPASTAIKVNNRLAHSMFDTLRPGAFVFPALRTSTTLLATPDGPTLGAVAFEPVVSMPASLAISGVSTFSSRLCFSYVPVFPVKKQSTTRGNNEKTNGSSLTCAMFFSKSVADQAVASRWLLFAGLICRRCCCARDGRDAVSNPTTDPKPRLASGLAASASSLAALTLSRASALVAI